MLIILKSFASPCPTKITPRSTIYNSFRYIAFSVVKCFVEADGSRSPGLIPLNLVR